MGTRVGDLGQIAVKLPGIKALFICGPNFARTLAVMLLAAADESDRTIAGLIAGTN